MNGAELLVKTAVLGGIEVCFANAGTTEIPIVMALDQTRGIKAILGLFEGVCTGAADGYGRMTGKPAMALLHLGPGLANGIANLHDARRAQTPLLNIVGEHATWHLPNDPPLAMDVDALTRTVSGWTRRNRATDTLSQDVSDAINAARLGQIASLVVPHDIQLARAADEQISSSAFGFDPLDESAIGNAAARLRAARRPALVLDGPALRGAGLEAASRVRASTRCDLYAPTFFSCAERGAGLPDVQRIPYFPEPALELLAGVDVAVIVGAHEPVTFFGYPGIPGRVINDAAEKIDLCDGRQDPVKALQALADALGAKAPERRAPSSPPPMPPQGALTPENACATLAAVQPENVIIVDEAITSGFTYYPLTAAAPQHTLLTIAGGSIGYGMPCATGAAIACPDRPVINLQADGSALYTVQALWTQAREGLHVITLICNNRGYRIVQAELARAGISSYGDNARALIDIEGPAVDWKSLARGFGVPAVSVDTVEALASELKIGLGEAGPRLIDMVLP